MSSITNDGTRPLHLQGYSASVHRVGAQRMPRTAPNPSTRQSRPPQFEAPCEACGKYGHPAVRCDMLGMALFLQRYCKDRANTDAIKESEQRWIERNKKFLPRDDRTPRTVLANYCAELQFSEDTVDMELDWEFLSNPDGSATLPDE